MHVSVKKSEADPYSFTDPPIVIRCIPLLPSPKSRRDSLKTDGSRFRRYKARYDCRGRRPRRPVRNNTTLRKIMGEYAHFSRIRPLFHFILQQYCRAVEGASPYVVTGVSRFSIGPPRASAPTARDIHFPLPLTEIGKLRRRP